VTPTSVASVAEEVLEHLERRRPAIVDDEAKIYAEVKAALVPFAEACREAELPDAYRDAVSEEIAAVVPGRWRAVAGGFTAMEKRGFGLWRDGDPVGRLAWVGAGGLIGMVVGALPFVPFRLKWIPLLLGALGWWLPDLQVRWYRRRYARELGDIVSGLARAQPVLDRRLLPSLPPKDEQP
jgi:hypothetical protein